MILNESAWPATVSSLTEDFARIGITKGMTLLVHSSLKSLNRWIVGGPQAVIQALEEAIGYDGTLVMPTHTADLSDPALWVNPPVPKDWWETIRQETPAFEPDLTPTLGMGKLPECFRKQNGTVRSYHPQVSFAARGPQAAFITDGHSLHYGLGEHSPLARMYDLNAWVLLLGVLYDNNTSLHLAEYRAHYSSKQQVKLGTSCKVNGSRQWVTLDDIRLDSEDFIKLGQSFERDSGLVRIGKIGDASVRLMPQRALVDYAKYWMERYR